jgi:ornithine cyclodeaminase/alanine dehydrogenase-like protein (mu-crystallin family)
VKVYEVEAIRQVVGLADLIEPLAKVFADFSRGLGEAPIVVFAPAGEMGDVHVKSAWMPGRSIFTVKVASWFAARATEGLSGNSGFIAVHDATTGDLRALLLDEHYLTDIRTAAAGAVATRQLAREDATTIAVLGTGTQARLQVQAISAIRPIENIVIWGRHPQAAGALCATLRAENPTLSVSVAGGAEQAVRPADVIVTATAARHPILEGGWLRPGQHVTAVGADDPTKAELDPACFERADILAVDSREGARAFAGDLRHSTRIVDTELGELLLGHHPGRRDPSQISIAKLVGLGIQDLATAETTLRLLEAQPQATGARPRAGP